MSTEALQSEVLETPLGSPARIAETARKKVARLPFVRRHPILTFLVLPLPALLLLWVGYLAGVVGALELFKSDVRQPWAEWVAGPLIHGLAYVPPLLLTGLLAWVAIRQRCRSAWWLAGAALIAAVAALMCVTFRMPTEPGTGMLSVGFGFPPPVAQWPQFVVPLTLAVALALWSEKMRSRTLPRDPQKTT